MRLPRSGLSRSAAILAFLGAAWALAGCAGVSATLPAGAPGAPADAAKPAKVVVQALSTFETRQRALAASAEQQGQWAQAAWAWEALHATRPTDEAVATRMRQARDAADSRATLLTQQARLAWQLADLGGARELFLRALLAQPTHAEAIEGLRSLEDERLRRQLVAPDPARIVSAGSAQTRSQAEFASMLVAQGAFEQAVEILAPLAAGRRADAAVRRQLSDVYLQLAQRQRAEQPTEALATLRKSLQMDSRNTRAVALQREWRPPAAATPRGRSGP